MDKTPDELLRKTRGVFEKSRRLVRQSRDKTAAGHPQLMVQLYVLLGAQTIEEVAKRARLRQPIVWKYLHGTRQPSVTNFLKMARALGISGKEFYSYLTRIWQITGKKV